jgi:hypothetical protein
MKNILYTSLVVALVAIGSSSAAISREEPAYFEAGQYSATLNQNTHEWRLRPISGDDVDIIDHSSTCANQQSIPRGVWLVTHDDSGHLQLVAPSATELPSGFPAQLSLSACEEGNDARAHVSVPQLVLEWLANNAGSVLIDD